MRIDFLKYLVPSEYKFRQKLIDSIFKIINGRGSMSFTMEDIMSGVTESRTKVDHVVLYFLANDYLSRSGSDSKPSFVMTRKGQTASIDREFLHTGRNERYKNVIAYGAWLGLISTTLAITTALYIAPRMVRLEKRIESMEQHVSQQSKASIREKAVHSSQPEQSLQKVDSVSLSRDSAMLRTAVNEKPNP